MKIQELEAQLMELVPEERIRLGEMLLGSVPSTLEFEREWADEANRRVAEIRSGKANLVSSEEMFREALESLK
jgi:putative addiction module component (TIGR02574 family)